MKHTPDPGLSSEREHHIEDPAHLEPDLTGASAAIVSRAPREEIVPLWTETLTGRFSPAITQENSKQVTLEVDARRLMVRVAAVAKVPHEAQATAEIRASIQPSDVLVLSYEARRTDVMKETGALEFLLERAGEPYTKYLRFMIRPNHDGTSVEVPFRMSPEYGGQPLRAVIRLAYQLQEVEITHVTLSNFGNIDPERLKLPPIAWYEGDEPDAPWRRTAEEQIRHVRMSDFTLQLLDPEGHPLSDGHVEVDLARHAFVFGATVSASGLVRDTGVAAEIYRGLVTQRFNRVTFENDMKDRFWYRAGRKETTLEAVQWLRERNIEVRGHTLVWPSWRKSRDEYQALKDRPEELRKAIDQHIRELVGAFRGQLIDWDVVNEPQSNHDMLDVLGWNEMTHWFQLAHEVDPQANLYLNDYGLLGNRGADLQQIERYKETLRTLLKQGAPVHGIGQQAHFWSGEFTAPTRLWEILDDLAPFDLPIMATEVSIAHLDGELQARYLRDLLTALFAHPSVNGIILWNFFEGRTHMNTWYLYRRDGTPTLTGDVWEDLVFRQWHTHEKINADKEGLIRWTGFRGDYRIHAMDGEGRLYEATVSWRDARTGTVKVIMTPVPPVQARSTV